MIVKALPLALIIASLTVLPSAVRGTEYVELDQSWWANLDYGHKISAVQGIMSGYEAGYVEGRHAEKDFVDPRFSQPFSKYIEGVDAWYRAHPNLTNIDVSLVLPCLADKPNIGCDARARFLSGK